mmetsp:Transcript_8478/g.14248  ORF Transcript_8478/g.14248 Transcript_8478/m.14248 type:complete len:307 (-) Transcript_8478:105-1025(-)
MGGGLILPIAPGGRAGSSGVLHDVFLLVGPLEVSPVVDVVVGVLGVPVGVSELILLNKVFLRSPEGSGAVGVLLIGEVSIGLVDVHLVLGHLEVDTAINLVLKPGSGHSQVVVGVNSDGQLSGDGVPRVLVELPLGRVSEGHLGHLVVGRRRPKNLYPLSLRVGDDLAGSVGLVTLVEDVDAHVDDHVGEVDLLLGGESNLDDSVGLLSGQAGRPPHQLFNVGVLGRVVPGAPQVSVDLLDILHAVGAVVGGEGSTLPHGMEVTHVVGGTNGLSVHTLDEVVVLLGGGELFGLDHVLVIKGVVGSS